MAVYPEYIEAPAAGAEPSAPPKRNPFLKGANPFMSSAAPGQAPYAGVPQEEPTRAEAFWKGLLHGGGNPLYGAAQLGARAAGSTAMDRPVEEREFKYLSNPAVADYPYTTAAGQIAGEVLSTLPLAFATGGSSVAARLGAGILQGAAGGALAPVMTGEDPDAYWGQKAIQGGAGAVTGGVMGGLGTLLSPPTIDPTRARLTGLWNDILKGAPETRGTFGALWADERGSGVVGGGGRAPGPTGPNYGPQVAAPPLQAGGQAIGPMSAGAVPQPGAATGPPLVPNYGPQIAMPPIQAGGQALPPISAAAPGPMGGGGRPPLAPPPIVPPGQQPPPLGGQPLGPMGPGVPRPPGGMAQGMPQPVAPRPPLPPEPRSWSEAARMLNQGGVRLSPGQALGESEMERSLQTYPILKGLVEGKVGKSLDDFNRSVMQQALSPVGIIVPRSVPAGHNLIEFGAKNLGVAYDRVLPNLTLRREGLATVLQSDPELTRLASEMATDDAARLARIVQNRVLGKFGGGDQIGGEVIKSIETDLGAMSARMANGPGQEISNALQVTLSKIRDELGRQNPEHAPDLQKINEAFSMFARVRNAASRDVDARSRFSPHDLLQALRAEDTSAGNSTFARGRAPMQAFAEAGNEIIGPSLRRPEHYTRSAARVATDALLGAASAPFYLGVGGMQARAPSVGFGLRQALPGASLDVGRRLDREEPRHSIGAE